MQQYLETQRIKSAPRLPLEGSIDLTYRCNNNCRHCWLRIPAGSPEAQHELSTDEISGVVDAARNMGCRKWFLSGGEPMLRADFPTILEHVLLKSASYSLNTNGTLITPAIARLLRAPGHKMVALYGATAEVHDHITRNPGSFEAAMRGFAYLKEAGAGFVVQVVPMRDNYYQFKDMVGLAESLSPHWRIGATWLWLSADGTRNDDIRQQRLAPSEIVRLDEPVLPTGERVRGDEDAECPRAAADDRTLAACIAGRRDFHIDPYGGMSFCCFAKDPSLRYDLKHGSFGQAWDEFIPSLADTVRGGGEYLENCGACELRSDCRWCPPRGHLEHGRLSAKVEYLCAVAQETRKWKWDRVKNHRRYYQIGGMTIQVEADLPITESTFHPLLRLFQVDGPGADNVSISHHFALPDVGPGELGTEIYRSPPWVVYRKGESWIYLMVSAAVAGEPIRRMTVFSGDYSKVATYSAGDEVFRRGDLRSLALLPTDQLLISQLMANRQGCQLHSSGVILDGKGLLFVGHSGAGKSTMVRMLADHSEILCDDRIIVRRWPEGFRIHGTWSHGEVSVVSPRSAPLSAILFLEKASQNRLVPMNDKRVILSRLLAYLIRPLMTAKWWEKSLPVVGTIAAEVPCFTLEFDKSGGVVETLRSLQAEHAGFKVLR